MKTKSKKRNKISKKKNIKLWFKSLKESRSVNLKMKNLLRKF
jgi:hypothetical protein